MGYKKALCIIAAVILILSFGILSGENNKDTPFEDVPKGHWAEEHIYKLRSLGITDGISESSFGMGLTINRSEFAAFLVKLMDWGLEYPDKGNFADNLDKSKWYFPYIETALVNGSIDNNIEFFRPGEPITREEMAVMIVRTLGYDSLSKRLSGYYKPFKDIDRNIGHIAIAKDFDIITGIGGGLFKPDNNAKREEAAAMIVRMYDRLNTNINHINGFYAIKSANQIDMIKSLNTVGFGWARLEYDQNKVILNTTNKNNNEFSIPVGFNNPLNMAKSNDTGAMLMVFAKDEKAADNGIPLVEYIIMEPQVRKTVISDIMEQLSFTEPGNISVEFDGVVIDFENLRGDKSKDNLSKFLRELKKELDKKKKKLYVAVHPTALPGQPYYDGYDFKAIGEIADKVILMAHDYYAKQLTEAEMEMGYTITPLTPIDDIYWALKQITDKDKGVQHLEKILVQLSFDSVQWKLKGGKVINKYPYSPDYEAIRRRLLEEDTEIKYLEVYENPYATFYNKEDETGNIVWYEDSRSINAKLKMIKMFGIEGISLWRLGNIPDYEDMSGKNIYLDIWQQIINKPPKAIS
ncbi:MAG: S-layer homology domain-containing protein [Firmicutes bacterium]|nr:S-layer homology domain-containing protein [Bacillota bacterium]